MDSMPSVREWATDRAEEISSRHAISSRTVRGWLETGFVSPQVADCLASMADDGVAPKKLNAMVYALMYGKPIGDRDLEDADDYRR